MGVNATLILASVLMALSMLGETIGYFARVIGALERKNALGYSIHVLIATYSRAGTLLGLPMVGYALDTGVSPWRISLVAIVTYGVFILASILFYFDQRALTYLVMWIYGRYELPTLDGPSGVKVALASVDSIQAMEKRRLVVAAAFAFFATSVSFFVASSAAAIWNSYRVTMLQMTPMMTAIGTLVSVTYLDPGVSRFLDKGRGGLDLFRSILVGRSLAAVTGALLAAAFGWGFRG